MTYCRTNEIFVQRKRQQLSCSLSRIELSRFYRWCMMAAMQKIVIEPARCTGCHSCEMACSLKHFGVCSLQHSRIRILEFPVSRRFVPLVCQSCVEATCMSVCPMNARIKHADGTIQTNEETCIGCHGCRFACPHSVTAVNPDTGKPISCDLCLDDERVPWCVRACGNQGALLFETEDDIIREKRKLWSSPIREGQTEFGDYTDQAGSGIVVVDM